MSQQGSNDVGDRTVVVTGARRGIGRGVAEYLLERGYRVVGCSRSEGAWEAPGFTYQSMDVTDERAVRSTFARIRKEFGGFYGLVHMAGLGPIMNHSLFVPGETTAKFLEQNTLGTFLVNREAAKIFRRQGVGRIINASSISVPLTLEGEVGYVASKAAVERMSQVLAKELAEFGVTVNVVGPAPTLTDALADVPRDKLDAMVASMPIDRYGTAEDVANVVEFFLSDRSDAITGQVLYLGGIPNT